MHAVKIPIHRRRGRRRKKEEEEEDVAPAYSEGMFVKSVCTLICLLYEC